MYPPPGIGTEPPLRSTTSAPTPGKGNGGAAGLDPRGPGRGAQKEGAGLGRPPRVDDRAALTADVAPVPDPRLRVDGFADRAEQSQRREVVAFREFRPPF